MTSAVLEDSSRRSRKSSSHFSEARKRGHTVLHHLTSHFSRRSCADVNLANVSSRKDALPIMHCFPQLPDHPPRSLYPSCQLTTLLLTGAHHLLLMSSSYEHVFP